MKTYRITFSDGPTGNCSEHLDIQAETEEDAFQKACKLPQRQSGHYTDLDIEELPEAGPMNVGIQFRYYDTAFKQEFTNYLIIRANSETDAVKYYNEHIRYHYFSEGRRGEVLKEGRNQYKQPVGTYLASCPGWNFDATAK